MARLKMQVMDEKGLGRMKDRVERMLEERGVHIDHQALCAALADNGCKVQDGQVRFPRAVLAQAAAAVPKEFTL